MDHDRSSGEGVGPQEYTALKMAVVEWGTAAARVKELVGDRKVFMVAATLRPETLYVKIPSLASLSSIADTDVTPQVRSDQLLCRSQHHLRTLPIFLDQGINGRGPLPHHSSRRSQHGLPRTPTGRGQSRGMCGRGQGKRVDWIQGERTQRRLEGGIRLAHGERQCHQGESL